MNVVWIPLYSLTKASKETSDQLYSIKHECVCSGGFMWFIPAHFYNGIEVISYVWYRSMQWLLLVTSGKQRWEIYPCMFWLNKAFHVWNLKILTIPWNSYLQRGSETGSEKFSDEIFPPTNILPQYFFSRSTFFSTRKLSWFKGILKELNFLWIC